MAQCDGHLEECVLHQDVVTGEDVPGAALATRGPAAIAQTWIIERSQLLVRADLEASLKALLWMSFE